MSLSSCLPSSSLSIPLHSVFVCFLLQCTHAGGDEPMLDATARWAPHCGPPLWSPTGLASHCLRLRCVFLVCISHHCSPARAWFHALMKLTRRALQEPPWPAPTITRTRKRQRQLIRAVWGQRQRRRIQSCVICLTSTLDQFTLEKCFYSENLSFLFLFVKIQMRQTPVYFPGFHMRHTFEIFHIACVTVLVGVVHLLVLHKTL